MQFLQCWKFSTFLVGLLQWCFLEVTQTGSHHCWGVWGDLGHLTKMAATPIYGKKLLEIFSSGTKGPMTLGLGIQHLGLRPNNVYSNDDLGLTLTFLRHCQRIKFTKPHNRPCKQKFWNSSSFSDCCKCLLPELVFIFPIWSPYLIWKAANYRWGSLKFCVLKLYHK